jgi:hypothetical protein
MSFDAPNSSWHPALMPNSHDQPKQATVEPPSSLPEAEPAEISKPITAIRNVDDETPDKSFGDEWFPEYETVDWAPEDESAPVAEENEVPAVEPSLAIEEPQKTPPPHALPTAMKHSSSPSFARTVSHEVSWAEDEDTEWTLPKAESDPFKFMPPSDRTNSFPIVPPLEQKAADHSLHIQQAEDIIHEIERQQDHEDPEAGLETAFQGSIDDELLGDEDVEGNETSHGYIGGELQGDNEEASDAGYE